MFLFRPKIYKNKVCVGYGNYCIKFKQDGKWLSVSTGKKNKGEANEFLRNWQGKQKEYSLEHTERLILDDLEVNNYSNGTMDLYRLVFRDLKAICNKPINEIGLPEINLFKKSKKHNKPKAVNVYLRTLKAIFRKAKSFKLIKDVPDFPLLPENEDTTQKVYSKEQFITLLKYLYNNGELIKRKSNEFGFSNFSNQMKLLDFCLIAFYTGCRRNEILNIKIGDIDPVNRVIPVIQTKKRGGKRFKHIPIHPYLWEKVIEPRLSDDPNNRLCDLKEDYVTNKIKKINRLLGFPELKLHSIRHTYASQLMSNNTNRYVIKDLLGHSAVSTSEIYVHTDNAVLQESNAKLPVLRY